MHVGRAHTQVRPGLKVGLLVLVFLMASQLPVVANHDVDNSHTINGVFHGYTRRYHSFDGGYHFHAWSDHGHGTKHAGVYHTGATHSHCLNTDNVDHVHCDAHLNSISHESWHDGPAGDDRTYGDGHGIDLHNKEAILS
jgi:hypothetical protein